MTEQLRSDLEAMARNRLIDRGIAMFNARNAKRNLPLFINHLGDFTTTIPALRKDHDGYVAGQVRRARELNREAVRMMRRARAEG